MFYITVVICDDGYYATINENEQINCKGEKFNKKIIYKHYLIEYAYYRFHFKKFQLVHAT